MKKPFVARIAQNQMMIDWLLCELKRMMQHGDAYGIQYFEAQLIEAKRRDKQGQMA
jgi:hypothetical protein